jgi:hypothetical protein
MALELKSGGARKRQGGRHPFLNTRVPAQLIDSVLAKAGERKVTVSTFVREALERYVESAGERDRAA